MGKKYILFFFVFEQHGIGTRKCGFAQPERRKLNNSKLPNSFKRVAITESKNYCGKFTKNGNYFVTGNQDQFLRVFDTSNSEYKIVNHIGVQDVSWCIVDLAFSPDEQNVAYSTWSSIGKKKKKKARKQLNKN